MGSEYNGILAIEAGSSSIRLLQYNLDEQLIDLAAIHPIEPEHIQNMQLLEEEIQGVLASSEAKARDVITCLQSQNMVAKRFLIDADEKDVHERLEWEISQQLLGSIDEFRIDFQEMSDSPEAEGRREFLIVACRSEYVDRITRLMYRIKINPILVDVDVFALQNAFEANYPDRIDQPALLFFTEGLYGQLVLCRNGKICDYDVLTIPPSVREENKGQWLAEEIQRFLLLPANQVLSPLGGMWVGGEIAETDQLLQDLGGGIKGVDVNILNPFQHIKIQEDLVAQMKGHTALCSIAVGLILRGIGG